ncbi:acid-sensing ion channel 1C isoform X3 [Acipenser ruthenus]|uniref:acid-sensing ion channel 1C isoform X3 n=1 Tax=Acipenser ruthenus TaxID=7906 RepID=UPI00145AB666|nr:acid-sensing ion channel 1C isoform X3 [Acipenser ruthenus]
MASVHHVLDPITRESNPSEEKQTSVTTQNDRPLTFKVITQSFVKKTKLHGLKYVFAHNSSKPRRAFWLFAFFICVGMLSVWSWNRILYLMSYPAVTKIHMVWAQNLSFPAVTICNHNLFRMSRLTKMDLYYSGYWLDLLHMNHSVNEKSLQVLRDDRKKLLMDLMDFNHYTPLAHFVVNTTEMMNRLSHQMDEMLLECKFQGGNCTFKNFTPIYTRYGKCYTFNSGLDGNPILTTLKGGTGNGLEIMLDIQQDEYLPVWGETDETSYEAGVKVQIHSQDEPPFIDQLGFGVAPGFQTFVSCQQQRLMYLPPPWGDCKSTPIESEFFSTYSITACRIDCETRYLIANCNCRMVHMPGNAIVCTPEQYKECADPALDFLVEKDNDYCVCETPCNMTRYGKELSMVKIPSKASAKYLAKKFNKTEQYIGENILVLDIFFEALNYETIEQKKAYEVAGLLGDIGGQMGLFIGASILTILEIFDYLYEVFKDKVFGYVKRKKRPKRSQSDNLEFPENPTSPGVTPNHVPRAPVIHSGVTRTVSDSRRTCYLVTRL